MERAQEPAADESPAPDDEPREPLTITGGQWILILIGLIYLAAIAWMLGGPLAKADPGCTAIRAYGGVAALSALAAGIAGSIMLAAVTLRGHPIWLKLLVAVACLMIALTVWLYAAFFSIVITCS